MVGNETDMTEHPDDILRALADPERLRIAGALAAGDAAAASTSSRVDAAARSRIVSVQSRRRAFPDRRFATFTTR